MAGKGPGAACHRCRRKVTIIVADQLCTPWVDRHGVERSGRFPPIDLFLTIAVARPSDPRHVGYRTLLELVDSSGRLECAIDPFRFLLQLWIRLGDARCELGRDETR